MRSGDRIAVTVQRAARLAMVLSASSILPGPGCTAADKSGTDSQQETGTTATDTTPCDTYGDPCACGNAAWLDDGTGYPTITDALAVVPSGGTVHVCAGTHEENLWIPVCPSPLCDDPEGSVTILGDSAGVEIASVNSSLSVINLWNDRDALGVTLESVRVTGGGGAPSETNFTEYGSPATSAGGGIYVAGGTLVVRDCEITRNSASFGGGIWANGSSEPLVTVAVDRSSVLSNVGSVGSGMYVGTYAVLESLDSDWGSADTDNVGSDVAVAATEAPPTYYSDYGAHSTFTCSLALGGCI